MVKLVIIPRYNNHIFDGAAGIYSSVHDMSKWALVLLNNSKLAERKKSIIRNTTQRINPTANRYCLQLQKLPTILILVVTD